MDLKDRRNQRGILAAALMGLAGALFLTGVSFFALKTENRELKARLSREIQQGIADEIFRLHVVANSDTKQDQDLKLEVKGAVVDYLETIVKPEATAEDTKEAVLTHLGEIEEKAEETVKAEGFDYPVTAAVERTYFPDKAYGDCTFPAGEYEALNVRIGEAGGENWWCVLYPSLCFLDDTCGIVSEEKKEDLREVLTQEEFLEIMQSPQEKKKVRVRFHWF